MRLCDLTQFYSPVSGGVKRYLAEKSRYVRERGGDEHVVIVPGARDECIAEGPVRFYTVRSPLLSRVSQYRVLWRLEAVEQILERERPHLIETGDPYQVGWKAMHSGRGLRIPVIGFYHSHFPEAYLRPAEKLLGRAVAEFLVDFSRRYVRCLYNKLARTLVPSPALGEVLSRWGVRNVVPTDLGVDTTVFKPSAEAGAAFRAKLGLKREDRLLLYVGRLAAEKNTRTLFAAFRRLAREDSHAHLLVIGDGLQRAEMARLQAEVPRVHWERYCDSPSELADRYRAADLFVHPGVQETFGLVTLEAQACGTPVLGIRGSYMDRIVHGSQAEWATENSAPALASAITRTLAITEGGDPSAMAACIAEHYSWPRIFDGLFDVYRQVAAEYQTQP